MSPNGEPGPEPNDLPWASIVWSAVALAVAELGRAFLRTTPLPMSHLSPVAFATAVVFGLLLVLLLHLGLGWLVALWLEPRSRHRALVGAALLFGWGWHLTLVQGDGLRSSAWYVPARVALALIVPGALAAFAWGVLLPGRLSARRRRGALAVAAAAGLAVNLFALSSYRDFHGYLALFVAVCLAWLLAPVARRRVSQIAALGAIAVVGLAMPIVGGERRVLEGNLRRLTRTAGPLLRTMPLTSPLLLETEPLVDPNATIPPEVAGQLAEAHGRERDEARRLGAEARGRNVLLVVLESTRADVWGDPAVTPEFARWRERGLWVPAAIAQYPATPLAYGAMFTSQPPSVVAQAPYWGKHRLFDRIADRFDVRVHTRPDIKWFDHTAITSFFVPEGDAVHEHGSTEDALRHLRDELGGLAPEESFFAWAHLYDPHAPWQPRHGFDFGEGAEGSYLSEVAHLDEELGGFMEWFFDQPAAAETLVLVIGDHGEGLGEIVYGEPYFQHHVHVSGIVSRVPFFAAGPGIPRGVIARELPVAQLDIMPTLFDFLGAVPPPELVVQGRSVYASLEEPALRSLPTEAFSIRGSEFFDFVASAGTRNEDPDELRESFRRINEDGTYAPKIGLQHGRWKIVWDAMLDRYWLYDVSADPLERSDLSLSNPEELRAMRDRLARWRMEQAWRIGRLDAVE